MASSRAYVPSRALLRALSRPQPLPCPFARHVVGSQFVRGKRTRAAKPSQPAKIKNESLGTKDMQQIVDKFEKDWSNDAFVEKMMEPPTDEDLETRDYPTIRWFEQDAERLEPPRLMDTLATKEDRKKMKQEYLMMEESYNNPDYDPVHLNRLLIDKLIQNPNFSDLSPQLQKIKESIKSKEEMAEDSARAAEAIKPLLEQRNVELKSEFINQFVELRNDPEYADLSKELDAVIESSKDLDMANPEDPKFIKPLEDLMSKLSKHEAFLEKYEANKAETEKNRRVAEEVRERMRKLMEPEDSMGSPWDAYDVEAAEKRFEEYRKALKASSRVLEATTGGSVLDADTRRLLNEDIRAQAPGEYNREMDMDEIGAEIEKLVKAQAVSQKGKKQKPKPAVEQEDDEYENLPPELKAKVDKIMDDPRLMEKLVYISNVIDDMEREKTDITTINHQTAPDPFKRDSEEVTTLKEQLKVAQEDPVHLAAIRRLHVRLRPPYSVSPALRLFNEAIELAYVGANEHIRRILWRTYQKARSIPTFLENLSDDAWDIIYYSQAVHWELHRNREAHLRLIIEDLKKVGRDGPPTSPRSLVGSSLGEEVKMA